MLSTYCREKLRRLEDERVTCHSIRASCTVLILSVLISCSPQTVDQTEWEDAPEVIGAHFTNGISEIWPKNSVSEFRLDQAEIYLWIQFRISEGPHRMRARIFDGSGELTYLASWDISPTYEIWATWFRYTVRNSDKPGTWKFEIYVDDRKLLEESLKVLPS